jgi:hypothetical protein
MSLRQEQEFFSEGDNIELRTSNGDADSTACCSIRCSMLDVFPRFKTISPCPAFRSSRDKWGMGVCQALFPMPTLGAHPFGGCQLPDAILHGKRSFRPRSRAVQCLATAGFRVRLFSLLGPMVAPPACKPGQDTPAIFFRVLTISTGSAAAFDSAFAPCHGSRLFTLRLHFTHSPAVSFLTSPALGSFSRGLPSRRALPGANAHFVPPFGVFLLADPVFA